MEEFKELMQDKSIEVELAENPLHTEPEGESDVDQFSADLEKHLEEADLVPEEKEFFAFYKALTLETVRPSNVVVNEYFMLVNQVVTKYHHTWLRFVIDILRKSVQVTHVPQTTKAHVECFVTRKKYPADETVIFKTILAGGLKSNDFVVYRPFVPLIYSLHLLNHFHSLISKKIKENPDLQVTHLKPYFELATKCKNYVMREMSMDVSLPAVM